MAELAALGAAASIVQLVAYATSIIGQINEICEHGSTEQVSRLKSFNDDLIEVQKAFTNRGPTHPKISPHLQAAERRLDSFVEECGTLTAEIKSILPAYRADGTASITSGGSNSTFSSLKNKIDQKVDRRALKASLQTIFHSSKITRLTQLLETYRSELGLHILAVVNAKNDVILDEQVTLSEAVEQSKDDIVEIITITERSLISQLENVSRKTVNETAKLNDKLTAAILKTRDGRITSTDLDYAGEQNPEWKQSAITFSSNESVSLGGPGHRACIEVNTDYTVISKTVLDLLFFRQIADRMEDLADAYTSTFEWIYKPAQPHVSHKWDDFTDWLESGSGCYWISGKPGSGKSTLMKYIWNNSRTHEALQKWAKGKPATASFYFWNLGTKLQKTQEGLLRSLLHDLALKHNQMIPALFPNLCRAAIAELNKHGNTDRISELSIHELTKAFTSLADKASEDLQVCLFVDGLDEYVGDEAQLARLLLKVSKSPFVKIVVSSRPTTECVTAFKHCPGLLLQDLTYLDILHYVQGNLLLHEDMRALQIMDRSCTADVIVEEVAEKASGVFLWVRLVVHTILRDLAAGRVFADLRKRIDELPTDLEELYDKLVASIDPRDLPEASQFLRLVLRSLEVQADNPLTLMQLSYADRVDVDQVLKMPIEALPDDEANLRTDFVRRRLIARCLGLVEVQTRTVKGKRGHHYVGLIHKTVVEFLHFDAIWQRLLGLELGQEFDVDLALLTGCVGEAKSLDSPDEVILSEDRAVSLQDFCFEYASAIETKYSRSETRLLIEVERALAKRWRAASRFKRLPNDVEWRRPLQEISKVLKIWKPESGWYEEDDRMNLAACYGLVLYMAEKTCLDSTTSQSCQDSLLVQLLLRLTGYVQCEVFTLARVPKAIFVLLKAGIDVNKENTKEWFWPGETFASSYWSGCGPISDEMVGFMRDCSPWEFVLSLALAPERIFYRRQNLLDPMDSDQKIDFGETYLEITKAMIHFGGDISAMRPFKSAGRPPHRQPLLYWRSACAIMQSLQQKLRSGLSGNPVVTNRSMIVCDEIVELLKSKGATNLEMPDERLVRSDHKKPGFQWRLSADAQLQAIPAPQARNTFPVDSKQQKSGFRERLRILKKQSISSR